jgi:acetyl esterase/lipase
MMSNSEITESAPVNASPWLTMHPLSPADAAVAAAARDMVAPMKGKMRGIAALQPFDDMMAHVAAPDGVRYEADTVGGLPGWWCRPAKASSGAILYLHGGWYSWGSAAAYRHFVGHVAAHAGIPAFALDYRLAPEHPFPAGALDVRGCWQALAQVGHGRLSWIPQIVSSPARSRSAGTMRWRCNFVSKRRSQS